MTDVMSGKKRRLGARGLSLAAVPLLALAALVGASPATAEDGAAAGALPGRVGFVQDADTNPPHVADLLSQAELAKVGETQDDAEINKIMSMAGPDQSVQVLINFDTMSYDAAVLVDEAAPAAGAPTAAAGLGPIAARAGVSNCAIGSAKGISVHSVSTFGWCGSGYWTGNISNWYTYQNKTSKNHLVGPSSLQWIACAGYTTCEISGTRTLGYVSFS